MSNILWSLGGAYPTWVVLMSLRGPVLACRGRGNALMPPFNESEENLPCVSRISHMTTPTDMAGGDAGRVRKELAECAKDTNSGVTAKPKGDSLTKLEGTILGPQGTPFEGGTFCINIDIPPGYPFEPPKMKFVTKIWHPNISSQTGAICLDILKDQWSPALTIKTALLSLQALMCSPEPDDPQDAEVANMYKLNRETYNQTARFWTETYAQVRDPGANEDVVRRVCDMGFPEAQARRALAASDWDEMAAINALLSGS